MKKFIVSTLLVLLAACTKSHHAENTVMITNLAGNSGGTGSVISSSKDYSEILTNRHVCRVVKNGGKVITEDGVVHTVLRYRPSTAHDVCVITVPGDLGLSLPVATRPLQKYEKLTVAGHPHLSPTIITEGYASSRIIVPVMTGTRDCKDSDREDPEKALFCLFFGKVPVIVFYDAQMTSALIQPGSSGSAVYNDAGELAGVAFAGAGDLGFGLIVPWDYVNYFLRLELKGIEPVYPDGDSSAADSESAAKAEVELTWKIFDFCNNHMDNKLCRQIRSTTN